MATPAQIAANQANAQKSTGPRSAEGKSASLVIPGEDPADYEALAAALLSGSPAAKLLARVQRQIAAHERAWYRANAEIRRARKPTEDAAGNSLDNYLERFHATTTAQLASIRQSTATAPPDSPKAWPPVDERTGRPCTSSAESPRNPWRSMSATRTQATMKTGSFLVDYRTLDQLRKTNPAWRLLVADNAPMIVSFLYKTFIQPNVRTMAQPELASRLADTLYGLREKLGEESFPRRAEQYLDDWAADSRGWLRK